MTQSFVDAITPYIDQDGLIGAHANPEKWSSGNELLETSTACIIEVKLNGRNSNLEFIQARQDAISHCRSKNGLFDKNPGRPDQITHDDLKAVSSCARICGMPFAKDIAKFGKDHFWNLSNTGQVYWDALTKPWDRAIYLMNAGETPSWYDFISCVIVFIFFSNVENPQSCRLGWLASESLAGFNAYLDFAIWIWKRKMRAVYQSVGDLMFACYDKNNPTHPFVVYGKLIKF